MTRLDELRQEAQERRDVRTRRVKAGFQGKSHEDDGLALLWAHLSRSEAAIDELLGIVNEVVDERDQWHDTCMGYVHSIGWLVQERDEARRLAGELANAHFQLGDYINFEEYDELFQRYEEQSKEWPE